MKHFDKICPALLGLATIGLASPAQAETPFAVSGGVGTTGVNLEAQLSLNDYFDLRGGYNYFKYSADDTYDDVAYDGELDLQTVGAFVDFRPFKNSFILTGGAYFGDKGVAADASPTTNVEIGDETFTPAQVGVLNLAADIGSTAPFAGLGIDTTFQGDGRFGFKFIVGAMFTDEPAITLIANGGDICAFDDPIQAAACEADPDAQAAALAEFQAELEKERANVEADIEDYKIYPVLQTGLTFRF